MTPAVARCGVLSVQHTPNPMALRRATWTANGLSPAPSPRTFAPSPNWPTYRKMNFPRKVFVNYSALRHTVREAQARVSLASATRANRFRPTRVVQEGDLIMYRDPRAQRAGGRTPWAKGLAGPATVVEITGNTVQARTTDGVAVRGIYLDDLVVIPPDESTSAPSPLVFGPDPHPVTASSNPAPTGALPKRTLKYYQQLLVGAHIAYSSAEHPDRTSASVKSHTSCNGIVLCCAPNGRPARRAPACPFPTLVHRCGRHGNHIRG